MKYMEQKMQQVMDASEEEYNQLMEEFSPPKDWERPLWEDGGRVHNWCNYANDGLRREWQNFTGKQKIMISSALDSVANREEWD